MTLFSTEKRFFLIKEILLKKNNKFMEANKNKKIKIHQIQDKFLTWGIKFLNFNLTD